jgi:hypothetical protein
MHGGSGAAPQETRGHRVDPRDAFATPVVRDPDNAIRAAVENRRRERDSMSILLDGSESAPARLVENGVEIERVARGRARHGEISAPTTNSRSRGVFGSPRAFCEAEKPRDRGDAHEEV